MLEANLTAFLLLPMGLGLLGFIEPCTIGGHLVFLGTLEGRRATQKILAALIFTAARTFVAGIFGIFAALLGQAFTGVQKGFWIVFGLVYLMIGLAYILDQAGVFKYRIQLAPSSWRTLQNPALLGLAFGLNIPACAAPILFALIGVAASTGNVLAGFFTMAVFALAVFALALSAPLLLIAAVPKLASWLDRISGRLRKMHWLLGLVFIGLGIWAIWFGIFVDVSKWSGK